MRCGPHFLAITALFTVLALGCDTTGQGTGDPAAQSWEREEGLGGGSTAGEGDPTSVSGFGSQGSCSQYPFEQIGEAQGAVERDLWSCLEPLESEAARQQLLVTDFHRAIWRRDCLYNVFVTYNQIGGNDARICVAYEAYAAAVRQFEAWEQGARQDGPRDERENVVP